MLGNTHNTTNTNAPVYDSAGNPVNAQGHHNASSSGGGIASKIPGTEAHAEKKAYEQGATTTGPGYGNNTYSNTGAQSAYGTGTTGSVAPDSHVGGHHNTTHSSTGTGGGIASKIPGTQAHDQTHGTHTGSHTGAAYGSNTGHSSTGTGGGLASKVPGTEAHAEKKAYEQGTTGTGYGNDYSTTGTHGTTGTAAHGSHVGDHHNTTHSSTTGSGGGIASKIPGTQAHDATHPSHHNTTTGTTTHGTHHDTTHGTHGTHGSHHVQDSTTHGHHAAGTDAHAKPSMADKIGGKIDVLVGKATKNDAKVAEGEIKQTEGKAGLAHNQGLATGPGHTTSTTGTTGTNY